MFALRFAQHVINTDNAVWPRGSGVVHHSGVGLDPDPSAVFGEEAVVLCCHLALVDYWKEERIAVGLGCP